VLAVVVPCFNEEAVLPETVARLRGVVEELEAEGLVAPGSYLLLVDDGSKDRTWELIATFHEDDPDVRGLKLSRNAGHQNALLAGLLAARDDADCLVSIDADLQDDVAAIREMVAAFLQGAEVVYGVRRDRGTDGWFKRMSAEGFYRLMEAMGVQIVFNHADYRLLSGRVVDHLAEFEEVNLFLRGIVPLLGFRSGTVYYDRAERFAGESKYPFKRMLGFAVDGITSFSVTPIRWVTLLGLAIFVLSVLAGVWAVVMKLLGHTVSGWASLIVSVWILGGVQLLSLGLIGEYVGKIYREVKRRPRYIVETSLGFGPAVGE